MKINVIEFLNSLTERGKSKQKKKSNKITGGINPSTLTWKDMFEQESCFDFKS